MVQKFGFILFEARYGLNIIDFEIKHGKRHDQSGKPIRKAYISSFESTNLLVLQIHSHDITSSYY